MAADFPQSNTLQYDTEFDDFEVTEVDGSILWDLLEELENEEKKSDTSELIAHEPDNMMSIVDEVSLEKNKICIPDSNSNWMEVEDMMMETDPLREIEGWLTDDMVGVVDFGYTVGDNSQLHSGVEANEITYHCLWEES